MKRKMPISKTICVLASLLIFAGLFSGCSESTKLSNLFDKDTVLIAAEEAVTLMNAQDYEAISNELVREDLRRALSPEILAEAADMILVETGEFIKFGKNTVSGMKDKDTSEEFAIAVLSAEYGKRTITYTVIFDVDMNLVGFYMK